MALCDPGDEIMVFEPFYANYTTFCKEFGAKINAVPTSVENGYHLPSEEEIEKYITPKTKAILLTNPGNPTGVVYTEAEQDMISRIVRKHNLALIADEVYREFVYDGAYRSFGTMPELDDNLIIIDSVSKRYSACGARIGCIISKNKELSKQVIKCCQARLCSPILEQVGAAALYTTPASYLEEVNKEYKKRRDTIVAALKKLPGVKASDRRALSISWLTCLLTMQKNLLSGLWKTSLSTAKPLCLLPATVSTTPPAAASTKHALLMY